MFSDTIDLLTFPTVPDRGRDVPDFTAVPAAVPISGVDVQPGASTELVTQRRDATAIRWSVYVPTSSLPAGVQITDKSVVRFRGERLQVDGQPMEWIEGSPLDYILVALIVWRPSQ